VIEGGVMQNELPIACAPSVFSPAERERWNELRRAWRTGVQEIRELPEGYAFRLDLDRAALPEIAEWIALERRCCPFLAFSLEIEPRGGAAWLGLSGGAGVKEVLRAGFSRSS
jgi:hypothetical protein